MLSLVKEMRKKISITSTLKKGTSNRNRGNKQISIYEGAPPG